MPIAYVHFDLQDGYLHNWLAGGPQVIPLSDTNPEQIFQKYYQPESGLSKTPVEQGKLGDGDFTVGDYQGTWAYFLCQEDHFLQHSQSFNKSHYLRSWAYAQLTSKEAQKVNLVLTTFGPADVWVNGEHLFRQETFQGQIPCHATIPALLQAGGNEVLVRFESLAIPTGTHAMALQVRKAKLSKASAQYQPATNVRVRLPSTIRHVERRNFLENLFEAAYLDREIFSPGDLIYVRWPDDWAVKDDVTLRYQKSDGWTYGEATVTTQPGERVFLGYNTQIAEGPYRILLTPKADELYKDNTRIQREIPIWCSGLSYVSNAPYGTYPEKLTEALGFAVRCPDNLFAEIAKMGMEHWASVNAEVIIQAIKRVNERQAGCSGELLGLLGMLQRFGSLPEFPEALKPDLEACILGYRYTQEDSGQDGKGYTPEGQLILLHACQVLAGQLFPKKTFKVSRKKGLWHLKQGEKATLAWMQQRASSGFETWNSPETFEQSLTALAHLVDLAKAEPVWELAAALMDKILFAIAINSFKGVMGAAQKSSQSRFVRSGAFQPTAGLTQLLWGMGAYNTRLSGLVSLALAKNYVIPPVLFEIATSPLEELWGQERHLFPSGEANLVTYKTPDTMLASVQDYHPGEKGQNEHIWQATLGATAIVYTNHPGSSGKENTPAPNFWLGNANLPRVAQWKDALIAIYNLPEEDWMGFTHAYFPTFAFDEYALRGDWAFARKGDGYLALTCSSGFQLIRQGHSAYCELRSSGKQAIWYCHVGRAALDGDFNQFQEKVLSSELVFGNLNIQCKTLRGEALSFGWSAPLLRDGKEEPLAGFQQYKNPYTETGMPSTAMEIRFKDDLLKLDFSGLS